jgi:hypothetical protein
MLNDYLANHVVLHWWLLVCGALVSLAILWFFAMCWLEIVKGFGRAVDFMSFKKKVCRADGTEYKFRIGFFFASWFNLTGFSEGTTITVPTGHRYQGFRKHVILGKFTGTQNPIPDFDDESDEV